MSVFERTIKAVASPGVISEIDRLQRIEHEDKAFDAVMKKFIRPAMLQFCADARKNGYWARIDHYGSNYLQFIPIHGSAELIERDETVELPACLFSIRLLLRRRDDTLNVGWDWDRGGLVRFYRKNRPGSEIQGPEGPVAFHDGKLALDHPDNYVPAVTSFSEAAKDWQQFVDTSLSEFLAHALQRADAESMRLYRPAELKVAPVSSPVSAPSSALREFWHGLRDGFYGRK